MTVIGDVTMVTELQGRSGAYSTDNVVAVVVHCASSKKKKKKEIQIYNTVYIIINSNYCYSLGGKAQRNLPCTRTHQ